MSDIQDIASGSAFVSGSGTLVWPAFAVSTIAHPSTGVYDVTLINAVSDSEYDFQAQVRSNFMLAGSATVQFINQLALRVRTEINGSPADIDFTLDIARKRTGAVAIPAPVPSAQPSPDGAVSNVTVYLSPTGNDANDGSLASPVLTPERAQDLIPIDYRGSATIQFLPGSYNYSQAVTFDSYPFGPRSSPLLLLGGFTNELGARPVSVFNDVDPGAGIAIADVQDASLAATIPAGLTGTITAVAGGLTTLTDPTLAAQITAASGIGDSFVFAGGFVTLTDLAGLFTSSMVGKFVALAGATSGGNNGAYLITAQTPTTITYANPTGVTEAFAGTWTTATIAQGDMWLVALGNSAGNNTTSTVVLANPLTGAIILRNPQGVLADANNGFIYSQRSYEGSFINWTTGANTGRRRMIRDHGVESQATFTEVATASHADFDTLTLPGLNSSGVIVPVVLSYRVTGAGPAPGPLTIDLTGIPAGTANQVAAITRAVINALLPSVLPIRAFMLGGDATGSAVVELKQMMLGGAGNSPILKAGAAGWLAAAVAGFGASVVTAAAPGTEISTNRPGFGTPRTTFRANAPWGSLPVVGDLFVIERPNVTLNYGATTNLTIIGGGGIIGLKALRFNNVAPIPAAATIGFMDGFTTLEAVEFVTNGGVVDARHYNAFCASGPIAGNEFWENAVPNPFFPQSDSAARRGAGAFIHDGTLSLAPFVFSASYYCLRNATVNLSGIHTAVAFFFMDAKRTTLNSAGALFLFNSGTYYARMDGQQAIVATAGIVNFVSLNGSNANNDGIVQQAEIINSGGHAIRCVGFGRSRISGVIGFGNVGNGIVAQNTGLLEVNTVVPIPALPTLTVTGAAGDMKSGTRAARSYVNFGASAPVANEFDALGDGSRIATAAATQRISETRSGTIAALGTFVDIVFGAGFGTGTPVIASLNTLDGTALQVISAIWQAGTTLRVTVNAAATGAVVVSATATQPTT